MIPKLYNGKDRTFFFVDYEGYRRDSQRLQLGNVPTLAMRRGDFSETAPIYDPLTTRANPSGTGFIRDPFPGQSDSREPLGSDHREADQRVSCAHQPRTVQ